MDNHISPRTVLDWKLVDAPELGYSTRDQPFPRGELLVKTTTAIPGYYKNPKARTHGRVQSVHVIFFFFGGGE